MRDERMMTSTATTADGPADPAQSPAIASSAPSPKSGRKALTTALLLASLTAMVLLSPLRGWLSDPSHVQQTLGQTGWAAYPLWALAIALLIAAGVPRVLLCALAAMAFGFWAGLILVQVASVLGYYAMFVFVRWGGRDWVLSRWPKLQHWARTVGNQGIIGVVIFRQLPLHGALINFCLALSAVGHTDFLVGTFIGLIPEAIPAALVGAGISQRHSPWIARSFVIGAVVLAVIWLICGRLIRRRHLASYPQPIGEMTS